MIPHLEDVNDETFVRFVSNIRNQDVIEITEKLDGSTALSFGKDENHMMWFSRGYKTKTKFQSIYEVPDDRKWRIFKKAMQALLKNELDLQLSPGDEIHCEVMYGPRPNTVNYGITGGVIVLLFSPDKAIKNLDLLPVVVDDEKWSFCSLKPLYNVSIFFPFSQEFHTLMKDQWQERICYEIDKKRIKQILVQHINIGEWVCLGGSEIEGLILRDKTTGKKIKLVDNFSPDGFTNRNRRLWKFRELCKNGTKVRDYRDWKTGLTWVEGVEARFKRMIVWGTPPQSHLRVIRSVNFKNEIKKHGGVDGYIRQKRVEENERYDLHRWIDHSFDYLNLLKEDFEIERGLYPPEIQERTERTFQDSVEKFKDLRRRYHYVTKKDILEIILWFNEH